jgi:hypothetical protein
MAENILQFEFSHVNGEETKTLDNVLMQCLERTIDVLELRLGGGVPIGSGIKTGIRIYDSGEQVTNVACRVKALEALCEKMVWKEVRPVSLVGCFNRFRLDRITHKIEISKSSIHEYAAEYLNRALHEPLNIGIEKNDHSFRPARNEEIHELIEAAKRAKSFWLFVFEPNDLLADVNKGIVSLM